MPGLLLAPTLTLILARMIRPLLRRILPVEGTLAADSLIQAPRRTSATVAALMLSLAMAMGFGGVTYSMRDAIDEWMTTALNPDFFMAASANLVSRSSTFPAGHRPVIEAVPGVASVQLVRNARIMYEKVPVMVVSVEVRETEGNSDARTHGRATWMKCTASRRKAKATIISDAFQANHQLKLGDVIELPTPSGILPLPVAGIIRDYSDMQGALFIDRERVRQELE